MASARKFRIKGLLGKGGFGMVYRATLVSEGGFQTEVAVKLLKSEELSRPMLARFKDEARVLGLIRDRAVVRVFPPAMLDNTPALIMEYVDGLATSSILKVNQGPLPERVVTEVMSEIARSLHDVFHQNGPDGTPLRLVHRDIKPANIQVTPNGTVKLLDFGIAKAAFEGREAETTAHLFGTPQYMAPERLAGETGPESDIWSLGCTWRRLMIGDRPIGGGRFKPSKRPPPFSPTLDEAKEFIATMIAIEPEDRPTAAEVHEFCEDLKQRQGGLTLRNWSGENIHSAPAEPDDLSGTVLMDSIAVDTASFDLSMPTAGATGATLQADMLAVELPPVTRSPMTRANETLGTLTVAQQETARRAMLGFGMVAFVLGLAGVCAGGYGLKLVYDGRQDLLIDAPIVAPADPAPPDPAPTTEPTVPVDPVDAVPEPAEPTVASPVPVPTEPANPPSPAPKPATPKPSPAPTPATPTPAPVEPVPVEPAPVEPAPTVVPTPAPAPAPVPVQNTTISVAAGGAIVVLRDAAGKRVQPGEVSPGRYELSAAFDKQDPSKVTRFPSFTVQAGETVQVVCQANLGRCLVR